MNLLDLMVKIGVDDQASKETERISGDLQGKLAKAAKVGAAALAAVTAATVALAKGFWDAAESVATFGDNIDKTSQKLGVSYEAFQKWDYVMNISGTSMNNMTMGLKTMTNQIDEARNGSADAAEKFEKLGISLDDLNSMTREEVFEAAIKGFQGMADSTERAALANDLFGRSGQDLTPLFNMSIEETNELMEAADRLGFVMSDKNVKASAAFIDAQTTLSKTMEGVKNRMMSEFLPAFTTVMEGIAELISGNVEKGTSIIHSGVTEALDIFQSSLPQFMDTAVSIMGGILSAIVQNLPRIIQTFLQGVAQMITSLAQNTDAMFDSATEFILSLMQAIVAATPDIIVALVNLVTNMLQTVVSRAPEFLASAVSLIANMAVGIIKSIPEILSAIGQLLWQAVSAPREFIGNMIQAGADLIGGLVQGISNSIGRVLDTILGGLKRAVQGALEFLGIASPSKLFRYIGGMTMEGMAEGIESSTDKALDAMESAVDKVSSAAVVDATVGLNAENGAFSNGYGATYNIDRVIVQADSESTIDSLMRDIERAAVMSGRAAYGRA